MEPWQDVWAKKGLGKGTEAMQSHSWVSFVDF
jgi:hypothetical protein